MSNEFIDQYRFIREYNDTHREQFNPELFHRDEDEIIEEIKKVVLSSQRSKYFTIRVDNFTVVDDYEEIINLLREQERFKTRNKNKNEKDNKYNYIPLNDSEIKLLIIDYYLEVQNPADEKFRNKNLRVLVEIPKIVDKYYFKIYGNMYSAMYQIVDGFTYNNSQSTNAKSQSVALKPMFMATRLYRWKEKIKTTEGNNIDCLFYISRIFNKNVPVMKYLLAHFGLYGTMDVLKINTIHISDKDPEDPHLHTIKKHNLYVSLPKYIYERDSTSQSLLYTIYGCINKDTNINDVYTKNFWLTSLGESFSNKSVEKGYQILDSLEHVLDITTQEVVKLDPEYKKDIYDILIWAIREFTELRQKDNLDVSIKRIRFAEYFAAIYAMKLAKGLFRISDEGVNTQLHQIEKAIYTFPDYLLKQLTKDRLVNYKNSVNDIDAFFALKYTYKGVSGVGDGEQQRTAIPVSYRQVHMSHLGRLDLDSSSNADPGLSGIICPLSPVHNNTFEDYQEPNNWRKETDDILNEYNKLIGLRQVVEFQKSIGINNDRAEVIDESIDIMKNLIKPIANVNNELDMLEINPVQYI